MLRKLFGGGGPAPSLPIHPEDAELVSDADVAWWSSVTLRELKRFAAENPVVRSVFVTSHMKYGGASKAAALGNAIRSVPRFYGTIEEREDSDPGLTPDDVALPWILKKRVDDGILIGEIKKAELRHSSSMNALVRRLIRDGKI